MTPREKEIYGLFKAADTDGSGTIELEEFLAASDRILGGSPARCILVVGGPGSGKGTQCELIVEKYGLVHISAGDLLRAAVKEGTPAGLEAKEYMDRGDLVPDSCVVTMVVDALDTPDAKEKGWLLDGYPRSASQADAIAEQLSTILADEG